MLPSRRYHDVLEAGCDEAGRGCLAGPVFAAAVILPSDFEEPTLNDSKQISKTERDRLRIVIEAQALAYAVSFCKPATIDKINILNASFEAMHLAIKRLQLMPKLLLIDGNRFKTFPGIEHECIIKGDSKVASIAAASILAKTYRDNYMLRKHKIHPQYGWDTNKGYPTQAHRRAILMHGPTSLHRRSFQLYPLPPQLSMF